MNVVALSGGASGKGIEILSKNNFKKLRLVPDNDEGGMKFVTRCLTKCRKHGLSCIASQIPRQYNDPNDWAQAGDAHVEELFNDNEILPGKLLALGMMEYDEEFRKFDRDTPGGLEDARQYAKKKAGKLSGHDQGDFIQALPSEIKPFIEEPKPMAGADMILDVAPINASELLSMKISKPQMIIGRGLLPAFGYTMLAASTKIGKTTLAVQMGLSIVSGTPFLGFPIERQSTVLYCYAENTMESMADLIRKQSEGWGAPIANLDRLHLLAVRGLRLQKNSTMEYLKDKIRETESEFVVIDPVTLCMEGDMNDISVIRSLVQQLKKVSSEMKVSWLLVHHFGKPTKQPRTPIQAMLGSSGWGNFCESFIGMSRYSVRRPPDYKRLSFAFRLDRDLEDMCICLDPTSRLFQLVENPDEITAVPVGRIEDILREYGEPMIFTSLRNLIEKEMDVSEAKASRLIKEASEAGVIFKGTGRHGKYSCHDIDSD